MADEAFLLGPGPATESYLKVEKILEVAAQSGAEAIHPGLRLPGRERRLREGLQEGRRSCSSGRPPKAIEAMGSKTQGPRADEGGRRADRARHHRAGRRRSKEAKQIAKEIGYPVAVKAAGGGGGKGFRVAMSEDELEKALEGAAREGEKFFSDPTVYLERYLEDPRHVEVQVLGRLHGQRRAPRRARLLGPAPPPEADRGDARARRRRGVPRAHRQDRDRRRARRSATARRARSRACWPTTPTASSSTSSSR